jgi:1-acyl-sn-glycerol-3-phosphate acyltransferase
MADGVTPGRADPVRLRSPALCAFFIRVMRRQMRRHFNGVRIDTAGDPRGFDMRRLEGRPLIVYSNHPSWWDPAFYILLSSQCFPGRAGFGPMDEAALRRYPFMRRIGIFGIEPDTRRGAAQFLRTGREIMDHPDAMLWVTAEGAFTDARVRPVTLRPGVAHLMARSRNAVALPLALEYVPWNERLPEALCRFGDPIEAAAEAEGVGVWQARLEGGLRRTMDALARKVVQRQPQGFDLLLAGNAGIGGIYDVWRRARSWLAGRQFQPQHDPDAG